MHSTEILPPGPFMTPRQTILFASETFRYFQRCASRYGDPFTIPITGVKTVFTSQPENIKRIFNADPNLFDTITSSNIGLAVGKHSLLVIAGTQHERERKLMMPSFHGARLHRYGHLIQAIAIEHANRWQSGQTLVMQQTNLAISLEVIIQVVFSIRQPARIAQFREVIVTFLKAFTPLIILFPSLRHVFAGFDPWKKFQTSLTVFDTLLEDEISARRQEGIEGEDILSMLLAARDESGEPMTDEQIRDEIKTLILAGYESIATSLSWAYYWIHRTPEVKQQLQSEVAPLGKMLDPETLTRLPYLKAVCQETLRMCPPVPFVIRVLKKPWTFCDYELPAGVAVGTAMGNAHFNPSVYSHPESFNPQRFLDRQYSPFEYLPFGGGARRCIGATFALYQMQIILGTVLARQELALYRQQAAIPSCLGFAISPKCGIKMVVKGNLN
jgi:cytochrome P450 family 110